MAQITKFDTHTLDELERLAYRSQNELALEIFKRYRNRTVLGTSMMDEQQALRNAGKEPQQGDASKSLHHGE